MLDIKKVQKQLKAIKFGGSGWNHAEMRELPSILHEDEKIAECSNGIYEGGFALLVATNMRVLLIDKKPLNYLNVEDLRFDMINEIDYAHRLMGATITISTGGKTLKFKSYNQARLRRLINSVQDHMSATKQKQSKQEDTQQQHLEEINKQLQMYLLAQHRQLQQQIDGMAGTSDAPALPQLDPKLADYLFAQRLLEQLQGGQIPAGMNPVATTQPITAPSVEPPMVQATVPRQSPVNLTDDARREVFGTNQPQRAASSQHPAPAALLKGLEINPLRIAYSKLPMVLRNRRFARPQPAQRQPARSQNQNQLATY